MGHSNNHKPTEELRIEVYNLHRDGEAVGLLWADGLMEMFPPLFVETALHPKVLTALVVLEALVLRWSWSWALVLPMIFLWFAGAMFLLIGALKLHTRWSRKTRIESSFTSSDNSEQKEILGQWVVLRERETTLGCVTLYREEEAEGKEVVWMSHLTIAPCLRRQGWGGRLASQAEAKAREMNATSIRILVGNIQSKPFWLERGYQPLYPKWTLLGHESLYMELDLRDDSATTCNGNSKR